MVAVRDRFCPKGEEKEIRRRPLGIVRLQHKQDFGKGGGNVGPLPEIEHLDFVTSIQIADGSRQNFGIKLKSTVCRQRALFANEVPFVRPVPIRGEVFAEVGGKTWSNLSGQGWKPESQEFYRR